MITANDLFTALAGKIVPAIHARFENYNACCILATRISIEVGKYFGVDVKPLAVQTIVCNKQFTTHIESGERLDPEKWAFDGSHSVGIGFGEPRKNSWMGHLISVSGDLFADFTVQQAERPEKGIITGHTIIGPWNPKWEEWREVRGGTTLEYSVLDNRVYLNAPDWKNKQLVWEIAGKLIRGVSKELNV